MSFRIEESHSSKDESWGYKTRSLASILLFFQLPYSTSLTDRYLKSVLPYLTKEKIQEFIFLPKLKIRI